MNGLRASVRPVLMYLLGGCIVLSGLWPRFAEGIAKLPAEFWAFAMLGGFFYFGGRELQKAMASRQAGKGGGES